MSDYNYTAQQGNIVEDPELTEYDNGDKVTRFSIAVSDTWQDEEEEWQERPNFFNVETIYDDQAERVAENYEKGNRVIISGNLHQDRWEDDDGNKRSRVKIEAKRISRDGYPNSENTPEEIIDETNVDESEEEDLFSKDKTPI